MYVKLNHAWLQIIIHDVNMLEINYVIAIIGIFEKNHHFCLLSLFWFTITLYIEQWLTKCPITYYVSM